MLNHEEIIIIISHNFGEVETTLENWIKFGPSSRKLLKPLKVKNKLTDKELPLKIIPLKYRNNKLSRFLIKLRFIKNPW